jgi:hypothetical protein
MRVDYRPLELSPRHPVINLTFGFVTRDAIPFLNPAEELFALAMNSVNIVVGELSPLLADFALQLVPLSFEGVFVHGSSMGF